MGKFFIKQHLGMGDNIVHNGMIRKLSLDNPNYDIYVPSKTHNFNNVKFMFRDTEKIKVVDIINDEGMFNHIEQNHYDHVVSSYLIGQTQFDYGQYFDDTFYLKVGMDPKVKKEFFKIERDLIKENIVYEKIISIVGSEKFNLIHEDVETNRVIDRGKISNNLPNFVITKDFNFFDLLYTIEMCSEFHIISSSFLSLSMCKKFNENTFAHMYSGRMELTNYISQNGINIIV
ncbi:MAG: hypothetical protein ACK5OW_01895 [bacterium]|jgi:hypothetical protein